MSPWRRFGRDTLRYLRDSPASVLANDQVPMAGSGTQMLPPDTWVVLSGTGIEVCNIGSTTPVALRYRVAGPDPDEHEESP